MAEGHRLPLAMIWRKLSCGRCSIVCSALDLLESLHCGPLARTCLITVVLKSAVVHHKFWLHEVQMMIDVTDMRYDTRLTLSSVQSNNALSLVAAGHFSLCAIVT